MDNRAVKGNIFKTKVIFIATYGRSGSTLLSAILSDIPDFHLSGENRNALWGIFESVATVKVAQEKSKIFRTGKNEPWYMINEVNLNRYARRLLQVFFDEIVKAPQGSRGVGFKEIRFFDNIERTQEFLEFIVKYIPHARIIFNIRDHYSVSQSGWYRGQSQEKVFKKLSSIEEEMKIFSAKYPDNAIICSYDDYINNPAALQNVFDLISERLDPERVQRVLDVPLTHGKKSF